MKYPKDSYKLLYNKCITDVSASGYITFLYYNITSIPLFLCVFMIGHPEYSILYY